LWWSRWGCRRSDLLRVCHRRVGLWRQGAVRSGSARSGQAWRRRRANARFCRWHRGGRGRCGGACPIYCGTGLRWLSGSAHLSRSCPADWMTGHVRACFCPGGCHLSLHPFSSRPTPRREGTYDYERDYEHPRHDRRHEDAFGRSRPREQCAEWSHPERAPPLGWIECGVGVQPSKGRFSYLEHPSVTGAAAVDVGHVAFSVVGRRDPMRCSARGHLGVRHSLNLQPTHCFRGDVDSPKVAAPDPYRTEGPCRVRAERSAGPVSILSPGSLGTP